MHRHISDRPGSHPGPDFVYGGTYGLPGKEQRSFAMRLIFTFQDYLE